MCIFCIIYNISSWLVQIPRNHSGPDAAHHSGLLAAAYKLASYLKNKKMVQTLYDIFIDPLITYASPAWNNLPKIRSRELSRAHRKMIILSLGKAHRPHLDNYDTYEDRCKILNIPTCTRRYHSIFWDVNSMWKDAINYNWQDEVRNPAAKPKIARNPHFHWPIQRTWWKGHKSEVFSKLLPNSSYQSTLWQSRSLI